MHANEGEVTGGYTRGETRSVAPVGAGETSCVGSPCPGHLCGVA